MLEVIKRLGIYPRSCVLELTLACNMRCLHCGSHAGRPRDDELSTEEWLDVADQLAALGCERVTIGGGEPTLRRDWTAVAGRLVERGVMVNVITNGHTWGPEQTRRARELALWNVAFSLDGLEPAHDFVRQRHGSCAEVLAGLELCAAEGVNTSVVTHVNRRNLDDLPALRRLLAERSVSAWQLQIGTPAGELSQHPELLIAPGDLLTIVPALAELRALQGRPKLFVSDNIGYYGRFERQLRDPNDIFGFWLGCRAGMQVIGVESNGNVKGCLSLPSARHEQADRFVAGNVRYSSLEAIWRRRGVFADTRCFSVEDLGGFCRRCPYGDICRGGCLWVSHSCSNGARENPYCFFRVAVERGALELLDEDDVARVRERMPELF